MKRNIILKILVIFLAITITGIHPTLASKADLEKEYTKKGTIAVQEFNDLFELIDTNNDGELSKKELEATGDKAINTLAKMNSTSLASSPAAVGKYNKNAARINVEYNTRRERYGLSVDSDTTAGKSSGDAVVKFYSPDKEDEKNGDESEKGSQKGIDDMMGDANSFVQSAKADVGQVNDSALQNFSSTFYNIFLTAGTAITVIVGLIIGIKYMLGSVEEKADIKTMLVPYVVGCIVVFGSFGIWKLVIEIMQKM